MRASWTFGSTLPPPSRWAVTCVVASPIVSQVSIESVTLPACRHERDALCHQQARLETLPCKVPCALRMPCGHACRSNCHVLDDPTHEQVRSGA